MTVARFSVMRLDVRDGSRAGEGFDIGSRRLIIGTDPDCDITLSDPEVSGEHASLKMLGGHVEVHDLGSRTGTLVNGAKIAAPTLLEAGDELRIGRAVLVVSAAAVRAAVASGASGAQPPSASALGAASSTRGGSRVSQRRSRRMIAALGAIGALLVVGVIAAVALSGGSSKPMPKPKPKPKVLTAEQLIANATPSIVRITGSEAAGSGFVIDARHELVLTNAHVVIGNSALTAQVGNDTASSTPLQVVAASPCDDLAIVRLTIPVPGLKALPLGSSASVRPGDTVTVLGFPGSFQTTPGSQQTGTQQSSTVVADTGTVSQVDIQATRIVAADLPGLDSSSSSDQPRRLGRAVAEQRRPGGRDQYVEQSRRAGSVLLNRDRLRQATAARPAGGPQPWAARLGSGPVGL